MNLKIKLAGIFIVLLSFNVVAQEKKIVLEIFEGTWCDACPEAIEIIDDVLLNHPNVIPVALHFGDQDPMNVDAAYQIASIFSGASAPGFMIDRHLFPNEANVALAVESNSLNNFLNERMAAAPVVAVELNNGNFDAATRILSIDVDVEFLANLELSIFNTNLYIVETLIQTDDPAYFQAGSGNNYPHKYVLRAMLGGEWGTYGAIDQSTVSPGDAFSYTYLTQIPADWDINKLQLIGLVQQTQQIQNYDMRPILNADKIQLNTLLSPIPTAINDLSEINTLNIFPNPSSNIFTIDINFVKSGNYNLKIKDVFGRTIKEPTAISLDEGKNEINIDLSDEPTGIYFVEFLNDKFSISKTISKQ